MEGMWFYLGLLVRNLVVFGVVLWSDILPLTGCSTNLSGGAKAAMFLFHQLACPFLILIVYYQLSSWMKDRREILQRLDGLAQRRLARSKQLTLSLVPDFASESLRRVPPIFWHRVAALHYEHCTLIQMDIVGFSGIVSRLNVKELVDVLNSLFSAIDFAAKCIGKVWKVETIGDCYIAVIGGPQPCEDHADRAIILAASIHEIVDVLSQAMTFPLSVRIGVHSGKVHASVMGRLLPRYLVFGRDIEVVNHLETVATKHSIRVSSATVALSKCEWAYATHGDVTMINNTEPVTSNLLMFTSEENRQVLSYNRKLYPFLCEFHRELDISIAGGGRGGGARADSGWKGRRVSLDASSIKRKGAGGDAGLAFRSWRDAGVGDERSAQETHNACDAVGSVAYLELEYPSGSAASLEPVQPLHVDVDVEGLLGFSENDESNGGWGGGGGGRALQATAAEVGSEYAMESCDWSRALDGSISGGSNVHPDVRVSVPGTETPATQGNAYFGGAARRVRISRKAIASKVTWWAKAAQWEPPKDVLPEFPGGGLRKSGAASSSSSNIQEEDSGVSSPDVSRRKEYAREASGLYRMCSL
jgi:class 3 adenylate cyclase